MTPYDLYMIILVGVAAGLVIALMARTGDDGSDPPRWY
jgi:hypothetical protein